MIPERRYRFYMTSKCQNHELKLISQYNGILYTGVQQTLSELSKKYNMYIVSNCHSGYIEAFLKVSILRILSVLETQELKNL